MVPNLWLGVPLNCHPEPCRTTSHETTCTGWTERARLTQPLLQEGNGQWDKVYRNRQQFCMSSLCVYLANTNGHNLTTSHHTRFIEHYFWYIYFHISVIYYIILHLFISRMQSPVFHPPKWKTSSLVQIQEYYIKILFVIGLTCFPLQIGSGK